MSVFGEPVDHVDFMKDWVVALLPRASAERIIRAKEMERAPIAITGQYYRFVDAAAGPMIGAFAPTGDVLARMLIDAFDADPALRSPHVPPRPAPDRMLVGCNYAVASQANFLKAARGAGQIMRKAATDVRQMAEESEPCPAQ